MTTVSRDTLGRQLPIFIRDVIKQNVTDLTNRVYKSATEEVEKALPTCYLDVSSKGREKISLDGTKYKGLPFYLAGEVWASDIATRDIIMDSIEAELADNTSTDGTDSMASKFVALKRITTSVDDKYISGYNKIVRVGTMTIVLSYYGA